MLKAWLCASCRYSTVRYSRRVIQKEKLKDHNTWRHALFQLKTKKHVFQSLFFLITSAIFSQKSVSGREINQSPCKHLHSSMQITCCSKRQSGCCLAGVQYSDRECFFLHNALLWYLFLQNICTFNQNACTVCYISWISWSLESQARFEPNIDISTQYNYPWLFYIVVKQTS